MTQELLTESEKQTQRLCGEIQLFDLCDLTWCNSRDGRFCTKSELLVRFERIADKDECESVPDLYDESDEDITGFGEDDNEVDFEEENSWKY